MKFRSRFFLPFIVFWISLILSTCTPKKPDESTNKNDCDTTMVCSTCELDIAFYNKDTTAVVKFIHDLRNMELKEFIPNIYHFSEVSGFGIALIDYSNTSYYKNTAVNQMLRSNWITLTDEYKNSKYFMRQPCKVVLVHEQYGWIYERKLSRSEAIHIVNDVFKKVPVFKE